MWVLTCAVSLTSDVDFVMDIRGTLFIDNKLLSEGTHANTNVYEMFLNN